MAADHECCELSSWLPNSTHLYLDFHLWSMAKAKRTNLLQAAQIKKIYRSVDATLQMLKLLNEPCNQVKLKTSWYHFLATPSPVCGTNILSNLFQLRGWHTQRKTHSNTVFAITLFHAADIWSFVGFSTYYLHTLPTIITIHSSKLSIMKTTQFTTTAFHMA